jgi:hypothetical protein
MNSTRFFGLALVSLALVACQKDEVVDVPVEGPVDFSSSGAAAAREAACTQNYDAGARKGAGAEEFNASMLWSVSPYLVLVPKTGEGYVTVNVDAPHYDWLLYTTSDVKIESQSGPAITFNGAVEECPDLDLVEYGLHHPALNSWSLLLRGEALSRAHFYAGLAATDHSDPNQAGHAGHRLDGDGNVPDHGDH